MRIARAAFGMAVACAAAASLADDGAATRPAAFCERDVIAVRLAFENEFVVEAYKKLGHRDPAWDADALAMLAAEIPAGLDAAASRFAKLPDVASLADRCAIAQRIYDGRCDDPVVLFEAGRAFRENDDPGDAAALFERADKAVDASPYATPVKLWIVDAAAAHAAPGAAAGFRTRIDALARAIVSDRALLPERRQGVWQATCDLLLPPGDDAAELATGDAIEHVPDADPWMYETIMGSVETNRAWRDRGSDVAASVTDAGWKGFAAHLAAARHHFEKAVAADDRWPQPFSMMITVAMGESAGNERQWFELASARQCDSQGAASRYLDALLPRWGGSHVAMLEAGVRAVDAGRFDTRGPAMLLDAVDRIERDVDAPLDARQLTRCYEPIARCLDGYIAQDGARPEVVRWARTLKAAWAARVERWADAEPQFAALESGGGKVDEAPFRAHGMRLRDVRPRAAALGGRYGDAVRAALARPERERADALAAVLASVDAADAGRAWLADQQARSALAAATAGGDWVALPIDPGLKDWRVGHGKWSVDADGALVGVSAQGLAIDSPAKLPPGCEVRLTVTLVDAGGDKDGSAVIRVAPGEARGQTSVRVTPERGGGTVGAAPFTLPVRGKSATLTIRVGRQSLSVVGDDGTVLATSDAPRTPSPPPMTVKGPDGKPYEIHVDGRGSGVAPDAGRARDVPRGPQLSFGTSGSADGATWRFSKIEIRVPKQ